MRMIRKPLNITTQRQLTRLRAILAEYESGTRVEEIAADRGVTRQMVYYWLGRARRLRNEERL